MTHVLQKIIPSRDPRLDWSPQHDPRSRRYGVGDALDPVNVPDVKKVWTPGVVLDQGEEGACVGFGWTAEALSSPRPYAWTTESAQPYAQSFYTRCKQIDEWDGEDYDGTSVLAGAKVAMERSWYNEYRWAFSVEEVRAAVTVFGPVVIGVVWYNSMYETLKGGLVNVDPGSGVAGGHCILVNGYHPNLRVSVDGHFQWHRAFRWRNSWGPSYGVNGHGWITYDALKLLLADFGEACVPVGRKAIRL